MQEPDKRSTLRRAADALNEVAKEHNWHAATQIANGCIFLYVTEVDKVHSYTNDRHGYKLNVRRACKPGS